MKERLKSYLEFKLDLELCGVSTFEKDDEIRELYQKYIKDKQPIKLTFRYGSTNPTIQKDISSNTLELKERKET